MNAKELTVEELVELLEARDTFKKRVQEEYKEEANNLLGEDLFKYKTDYHTEGEMMKLLRQRTAENLKKDSSDGILLRKGELKSFTPMLLEEISQESGDDVCEDKDSKKYIKTLEGLNTIIENIFDNLSIKTKESISDYDANWQWLQIVMDLAEEQKSSPKELILSKESNDEITRRFLSKEEFIDYQNRSLFLYCDANKIWEETIMPALYTAFYACADDDDAYTDDDDDKIDISVDGINDLIEEIKEKMLPKLKEEMSKMRKVLEEILNKEIERIYSKI